MASVTKRKNPDGSFKGWQCCLSNGKFLWLGKLNKSDASYVTSKITSLERTAKLNTPPSPEVVEWIGSLSDKFKAKLEKAGLINLEQRLTVNELLDNSIKRSEAKPQTIVVIEASYRVFREMFGDKLICNITEDDLFNFRDALSCFGANTKYNYFNRVKGILSKSKEFDKELFANVRVKKAQVDFTKRDYIERHEIIEAIGRVDVEFGAVLACAGLLGMRTRSEPAVLRWEHIDFNKNLVSIPAVKTHARLSPLYADAKAVLVKYHESKGCPKSGLVFPELQTASTLWLRATTVFGREIRKPFQRLRSSCESYLVNEAGFSLTDCSRWLGHSPLTAMKNHNQTSPATLERASTLGG